MSERLSEVFAALADEGIVAAASDEDLAALDTELRESFEAIRTGDSTDKVTELTEIANHVEGISFVRAERTERAAAEKAEIDAQAARLAIDDTPDAGDPVILEPAPAAPAAPAELPEPVPAVATAPAPVPALSTVTPPAAQQPTNVSAARTNERITRLRDGQMRDFDGLVEDTVEMLHQMEGNPVMQDMNIPVGRLSIEDEFADDFRLNNDTDATAVYNDRLNRIVRDAWLPEKWSPESLTAAGVPDSLVATGGFCAPAQPDYNIPQIAGTQRPVADYLPTVQADRGQIIVLQPPKLSAVTTSTAQTAGSAVSIWTNTVDVTPGGTVKPVQSMTCPSPITVSTQAIVEQVKVGNFQARAFPENVRAVLANTAAAWARVAESQLLSQISTNSTAVTTTQILGATNDYFGRLRQAAFAIRNRHRMPYDAKLRVLIPAWFIDFVGSDLAHNHPGDGLERFTQDQEGFVRAAFASANTNVTFYQDSAVLTAGLTQQTAVAVQGPTDIANWPPGPGATSARVIWYLFPEGTFSRADAGTLDLGIVRDSTLNGTNDYEFFTESWEAVIPKVIESYAVTSTLCDTGQGAIDVTSASFCTSS